MRRKKYYIGYQMTLPKPLYQFLQRTFLLTKAHSQECVIQGLTTKRRNGHIQKRGCPQGIRENYL